VPFSVIPEVAAPEDLRLAHRFIDLRRSKMHSNIVRRSQIIAGIRQRMHALGFLEYQTPTLTASSPEGARDYLVPARRHPGKFYALPQAPQMFKQLIMISGFDRYFQIAPCYRDEDARADRSPGEFYQLDLEMSFVTQEDVFAVIENLMFGLFREFAPEKQLPPPPFPRITYEDAILQYGTDKPDLRNPIRIVDLTSVFPASASFRAFAGKFVRAIRIEKGAERSRSFFDRLEEDAKTAGAKGLAWVQVESDRQIKGPIAKFIGPAETEAILAATGAVPGDAVTFMADESSERASKLMGTIRDKLGALLELVETNVFRFCWIVDFPMYELNPDTGKVEFSHNPFSMPQGGLAALNEKDPLHIKAFQYDIVCNGYELSSGAIRNHSPETMYRAFEIAGYSREEVDQRFRALITALKYGAPPHGGIAPGIDRIVMLLTDERNIREVIMFPMNQNAEDLMMNAPNTVRPEQLKELHIRLDLPRERK
jgi:aspartyl-tRNA synthetase